MRHEVLEHELRRLEVLLLQYLVAGDAQLACLVVYKCDYLPEFHWNWYTKQCS